MRLSRLAAVVIVLPVSLLTLACGAPSHGTPFNLPQSVTVGPATANPNSATGQVQFTAVENWSTPPLSVVLSKTNWGVCINGTPTTAVTVTDTGLAACTSAANGTYTVFASVPTYCESITACGGGCQITGTAKLTCP